MKLIFLIIGGVLLSAATASSAEFIVHSEAPLVVDERGQGNCNIEFKGEIVAGDAKRLSQFLEKNKFYFDNFEDEFNFHQSNGDGYDLCLSGPGGSFSEALLLVNEISTNGIITVVPRQQQCLSACAVAFMSGLYSTEGEETARMLMPGADLGFHAPNIELGGSGQYPIEMVETAYRTALQDIYGVLSSLGVNSRFGYEPRLRASLFAQMIGTPPAEMFHVSTVDHAGRWDIYYVDGPTDAVRNSEANLLQACTNYGSWIDDQVSFSYTDRLNGGSVGSLIEKVTDAGAEEGEEVWRYTLDTGQYPPVCTFFIPAGLTMLGDAEVRVEVVSTDSGRQQTFWIPSWAYLRPDTTLVDAGKRGGGL